MGIKYLLSIVMAADMSLSSSPIAQENGKWLIRNQQAEYVIDGQKAKGLTQIDEKYYYFDNQGHQKVGWLKIKKQYYYFKIASKEKGYMIKNKTINHVRLSKSGAAISKENSKRLEVLVKAQKETYQHTKLMMPRYIKRQKMWDYFQKTYLYRGSPIFHHTKNWDVDYADKVFKEKKGSCYDLAATFAFIANSCGYTKCYSVSSGGHGWCEINGYVYDPAWARIDLKHSYYHVNMNLSGKQGRPNYRKARRFIKKV